MGIENCHGSNLHMSIGELGVQVTEEAEFCVFTPVPQFRSFESYKHDKILRQGTNNMECCFEG